MLQLRKPGIEPGTSRALSESAAAELLKLVRLFAGLLLPHARSLPPYPLSGKGDGEAPSAPVEPLFPDTWTYTT